MEVGRVVLVDLPTAMSVRVLEVLKDAAPKVSVQRTDRSALRFSNTLPAGSLLILCDPCGAQSAAAYLKRVRERGMSSPALILGLAGVPQVPTGEQLEPVDAIALGDLDVFSFRRSLALLANERLKDHFLEEMAHRLRAYERLLEAKDDERVRVLEVAGALERQLAEKEEAIHALEVGSVAQQVAPSPEMGVESADFLHGTYGEFSTVLSAVPGSEGATGPTGDAFAALDLNDSELAGGFLVDDDEIPSSQFIPPQDRVASAGDLEVRTRQLEKRLSEVEQERAAAESLLNDLRKHSVTRERELRRLQAQSASAGDLAQRLEASELLRREQTREMLRYQQQIDDLEERLETILSLVDAGPESGGLEPAEMLEHLGERLRRVESERRAQQGTINQLSRSLAVQQVDDTLDNAQSRRNVLQRVEEAVRCSLQANKPLTAMMMAIEGPGEIRRRHGSVLYDFMLVQVAQRLQLALRRHELLMRYGDEAFVLLTSVPSAQAARSHAERLQQAVSATSLELGTQHFNPSIRIAIVPYREEMHGANDLLRQTLRLLLDAEAEAKEQIVLSSTFPSLDSP